VNRNDAIALESQGDEIGRRVIVPGGRLIVSDVIAPKTSLLDTSLQVIEFLRDASHVRDYRVSESCAIKREVGFSDPTVTSWKLPLGFNSWVARIGTPPPESLLYELCSRNSPASKRIFSHRCFPVFPDRFSLVRGVEGELNDSRE
jgi:hypothetical protein